MASVLMKSISGIRGVVGDTFTPDLILRAASAFAKYSKFGTIVVGRDTRPTGQAICDGVKSILSLSGCRVVDIGIVPTPTVQIMVEELRAAGGIVVSASHNPVQWNAFKLIGESGTFLGPKEIKKYFTLMDSPFRYKKWDEVGLISASEDAARVHIGRVLSVIDHKKIYKRRFRVALDCVNGAGSQITFRLLSELGCEVVPLNCELSGDFSRGAEPIAENLKALSSAVKVNHADVGFAQDPDADRLAIVDDQGRPIGEEYTIALVAEHLLSKEPGPVVVNLSTTRAVEDIAGLYGVPFRRARVGEINVVEEMIKANARIGGEGNGGVISPEVHMGRDSLVGIGYVLEMLATRGRSLSQIVDGLPAYVMKKGKIVLANPASSQKILSRIKAEFGKERISEIDGLRIDFRRHEHFKGGWIHLRPSNTEPIFRIIAEGRDEAHLRIIYNHFSSYFDSVK